MRVETDELERQADEMRRMVQRLSELEDQVLRIARTLSRESSTEQFCRPLWSAADSIGRRGDELKQLRSCLRQIARTYEVSESRIVDEADAVVVHNEQSPYVLTRIPSPRDWLGPLVGLDG